MIRKVEKESGFRLQDLPQDVLNRGRDMADMGRDVWLAGLGALAAVEDEGSSMFNRLVTRGEEVEDRGRKQLGTVRNRINNRQKEVTQAVEDTVAEPLLGAMKRFGFPTRNEVRELNTRLETLNRKVDTLVTRLGEERRRPRRQERVFSVVSIDDGWAIRRTGREQPVSTFPTKEAALDAARTLAQKNQPAKLEVYKMDGTLQETFEYAG